MGSLAPAARVLRARRKNLVPLLGSLALLAAQAALADDVVYSGWIPVHDGSFEGDISWGPLMSPLPPGVGGVLAQRMWVDGNVDTVRVGLRARPDGPIPASVTLDIYVWADASGAPGTLLGLRTGQVRVLPAVVDPLGEGWQVDVGFPIPVAAETPWVGVRIRSTSPSATLALRTDLNGLNTLAPVTFAPPGAPFGSGWQSASTNFGPVAALAVTPHMDHVVPPGSPARGAGGDGEYGFTAAGEWTFERFAEPPPLHEGCFGGQDAVGDLPDPGGWTLAEGASLSAGVLPSAYPGESDADRVAAGTVGHSLWFYDPLSNGFPAGHEGLFQTPELDLETLDLTGGPLAYRFHSLTVPDAPEDVTDLRWVVASRSRGSDLQWGPWFELTASVQPDAHIHYVPLLAQGDKVQAKAGVKNPKEEPKSSNGAKADKGTISKTKVVTGPDPTMKGPVPQFDRSLEGFQHLRCVNAVAACLAYWAQNNYPELRAASGSPAAKNKTLADELAEIMEKITGTGSNKKLAGNSGISDFLKKKKVHVDTPGGRKKLTSHYMAGDTVTWGRIKDQLSRSHDVMLVVRAYGPDGTTPLPGDDGTNWSTQLTVVEMTTLGDAPNQKHSIRASNPEKAGTVHEDKLVTKEQREKTYPAIPATLDGGGSGDGHVTLDLKAEGKPTDAVYKVEEVVIVRPDPPSPLPGEGGGSPLSTVLVAQASTTRQLHPENGGLANYSYSITAPPEGPLMYVAARIDVPYTNVISPPGWVWEPMPSLRPGGTGCEQYIGLDGIAWRSQGADISAGATLSGFGFSADAKFPTESDGLVWLTVRPAYVGTYSFSGGPVPFPTTTDVSPGERPAVLTMFGAIPTPTRGSVQVLFSAPSAGRASAVWVDAQGRRCAGAEIPLVAGLNRLDWDGRNAAGRRVPPGVYFCRIEVDGRELSARAVLTAR